MFNRALRAVLLTPIAILFPSIALLSGCSDATEIFEGFRDLPFSVTDDATIDYISVNGEPVAREEIVLLAQISRSKVIGHFKGSPASSPGPEFWDQAFDGVTPRTELMRRTLVHTVEYKVRILMAREQGIRGEVSYESLERRWQVENLRRKEALEKGQEVFGPAQYTLVEYFENDLLSLDVALMQRLEEKDLLKEADSIWDRKPGESRLERMKRLYTAYVKGEVEKAIVRVNSQKLYSLDLVSSEPSPQDPEAFQ